MATNRPYASVSLVEQKQSVQELVGKFDEWQPEMMRMGTDSYEEGERKFRILRAWVNKEYYPSQFPEGYVFVDTEPIE